MQFLTASIFFLVEFRILVCEVGVPAHVIIVLVLGFMDCNEERRQNSSFWMKLFVCLKSESRYDTDSWLL